jgi:Carboxypeptidase regulatory-like domain/TonB dependent receptor/TonB-dependent Receptor Plug Domain
VWVTGFPCASRRALAVAALLLCARASPGQTTGSIEGRLTDSDGGALPGAAVSASSPSLQGTRTGVADHDGAFRFPGVPPGDYTVRAVLPGFRPTEKTATVRLDGTARVDLVLEPLREEEVVVSGSSAPIDTASTTTGTNYTSSVIARLPVSRNYADIVRSNPGVSSDRGDTEGRSLALTVYGATSAENRWIIDGVDTTNVFKGIQGKAINNEFVQEVEVATGGYQAEYGRALGGIVNVVTKSGGNAYHGDGFVYYDSTGTTATQKFEPGDSGLEEMRVADGSRWDYGADLGGYILKDRLWIFAAFNRVELRGHLSRVESSALVSSDERFPFDSVGDLYSGKLTWNPGPSTTVVAALFADPSTTSGAAGADPRQGLGAIFVTPVVSPVPSTWYSARDQGGTDFGIRLNQLFGSRAIATLQGSYHRDKNALTAPDGIRYEDWRCAGGTASSPCDPPPEPSNITGGYGFIQALLDHSESSRRQFRGDVSLFGGNHQIKAGGDYVDGRTEGIGAFTGGQSVEIHNEYGQLYYAHTFNAVSRQDPTLVAQIFRKAEVQDFGGYLQDSWRAAPGLTINAGLRWDGENAIDYAGVEVLALRTSWQPRIGVTWDPWNNGATKVTAFAGRFSYAMPTGQTAAIFANITGLTTYNFDPVSVVQDPNVIGHGRQVVDAGGGPFGSPVDSGIVAPYQDELTLGIERLFGSSLTVGLTATYRRLGSAIENRCDFDRSSAATDHSRCAIITPGSSGAFASGEVPTCNGLVDDPAWYSCEPTGPATPPAKRVYRGIELLARQTVGDRLWFQASYVYSSLRGNYDGGVNEGLFGRSIPGRNEDFDYPALWHDGYGILFLDRPQRLRLDGYWVSPWGLSVGVQAFVESGAPLNQLGYFNFNYGSMVFLVPRGSAGRLPALWGANLTLGYPIPLGPVTVTVQAYLFDIFNKQIAISRDEAWSSSPPQGFPATIYDPNQEQNNPDYGTVTGRSEPRSFRAALRISF